METQHSTPKEIEKEPNQTLQNVSREVSVAFTNAIGAVLDPIFHPKEKPIKEEE